MRIAIVAPIRPGATSGNDVTAARWARRLAELGHETSVVPVGADPADQITLGNHGDGAAADLLVALHARRCAPAVAWWNATFPDRPIVVGLAGTDLYHDLPDDADARRSLSFATRIVVLQPAAIDRLAGFDGDAASKAHVVAQSVELPDVDGQPLRHRPDPGRFGIAVLAHLREVKDPLLAARAARLVRDGSRVRVDHAGVAHDDAWEKSAREEMDTNPRYHWHGELRRDEALRLLARSTVLACTSRLEGGANVVSEAIALGVPVVGTRIDGNTGVLGDDYPGLVDVGDAPALARLFERLEHDPTLLDDLRRRVTDRRPLTTPEAERDAWSIVLDALP